MIFLLFLLVWNIQMEEEELPWGFLDIRVHTTSSNLWLLKAVFRVQLGETSWLIVDENFFTQKSYEVEKDFLSLVLWMVCIMKMRAEVWDWVPVPPYKDLINSCLWDSVGTEFFHDSQTVVWGPPSIRITLSTWIKTQILELFHRPTESISEGRAKEVLCSTQV